MHIGTTVTQKSSGTLGLVALVFLIIPALGTIEKEPLSNHQQENTEQEIREAIENVAAADPEDKRVLYEELERKVKANPKEAVKPLIDILIESGVGDERSFVTQYLLSVVGEPAVPDILERLGKEHGWQKQTILVILGHIGAPGSLEPVADILLHDEDAMVRNIAARTVGKIGGEGAVAPLIEALKRGFAEKSAIVEGLTFIGKDAIKPLIGIVDDGSINTDIRKSAAQALQRIGRDAVRPLIEILQSEDRFTRLMAVQVLGRLRDARAAGPLADLLTDQETEVRAAAAKAFEAVGNESAMEPLKNTLGDVDCAVREATAAALGIVGDKRALPVLQELSERDPAEKVRKEAADAFRRIRAREEEGINWGRAAYGLACSVELDREVYGTYDEIKATVRIKNVTKRPLRIHKSPYWLMAEVHNSHFSMTLYNKKQLKIKQEVSEEHERYQLVFNHSSKPTMLLKPKETLSKTIVFSLSPEGIPYFGGLFELDKYRFSIAYHGPEFAPASVRSNDVEFKVKAK